jgi:hypothetical protein
MSKSVALQYYYDKIKNNDDYMEYRRLKKQEWNLNNKHYVSDYYKVYREINKEKLNLNSMVWRLERKASEADTSEAEKQEVAK